MLYPSDFRNLAKQSRKGLENETFLDSRSCCGDGPDGGMGMIKVYKLYSELVIRFFPSR